MNLSFYEQVATVAGTDDSAAPVRVAFQGVDDAYSEWAAQRILSVRRRAADNTVRANNMAHGNMKHVFLGFSAEEQAHKAQPIAVKNGKTLERDEKKIMDLKIGDSLADVQLTPGLEYQDALIHAMKADKAAFKLCSALAGAADDEDLRPLFLRLAPEEAKQKLRFEIEYDNRVYRDN